MLPLTDPCRVGGSIASRLPFFRESKSAEQAKIDQAAKHALSSLTLAFSVNCAVMSFVGAPITMAMMNLYLLSVLIDVTAKSALHLYRGGQSEHCNVWHAIHKVVSEAREATNFSWVNLVGLAGPNILIHELGHAIAASACFKNAQPKISIFPFLGGATQFFPSDKLTALGKYLGESASLAAITAAGMTASSLWAMSEFLVAHLIKESFPNISEWLELHGVSQLLGDICYGISALYVDLNDPEILSHDFVRLWAMWGIHPFIPVGLMILLPLLEKCLLMLFEQVQEKKKNVPQNPLIFWA